MTDSMSSDDDQDYYSNRDSLQGIENDDEEDCDWISRNVISCQCVQYFVTTPSKMTRSSVAQKNIQLLRDVTGAFTPHVLTAPTRVSGAGKTTLLDVLSGRTTYGTIQGDIRIAWLRLGKEINQKTKMVTQIPCFL